MRLQKYLSLCGIASRRKSEQIILNGRVKVNENIVNKMGFDVNLNDIVKLDDRIIIPDEKVYIVLNKPKNIICTQNDRINRKTIFDIVKYKKKLFSAGRLDKDSTGLIILTNDGDFTNSVIHPSKNIIKEYYVESYTMPNDDLIKNFKKGIIIDGILYKAKDVEKTENKNALKIYLNEGRKREIRIVYDYFSIKIKDLKRTAIGGLKLKDLKIREGEYKFLKFNEINDLILKTKREKYGKTD